MLNKSSKEKYLKFCEENNLRIYYQPWWLDVVCHGCDNWYPILHEVNGKVLAAQPLFIARIAKVFTAIKMPLLTQILGPVLVDLSHLSIPKRYSAEIAIYSDLINQLPNVDYYIQSFSHDFQNWLPYYWKNFNQSTKYTYSLPNLSNLDAVWSGFRDNIRTDIRKAQDRFKIKIRLDLPIHDFITLYAKTFARQGKTLPYSHSFIRRLDEVCESNSSRAIFIAVDEEGRQHAGVYIVWDKQSAYYLMGGGDPELRSSGATSLCLWEAIRFAATKTKSFDFEGSMIESVERFFRAFGAEQVQYFTIKKTRSQLLRFAEYFRSIISIKE